MIFFRLIREGFLFAINSIVVNKLRTFLSLFGITIGIFAIISVFTVLDWMESSVHESIASMGDDVIYVQKMPWSFDPNIAWWDIIAWPVVTIDDYESLLRNSTKSETASFSVIFTRNLKYRDNAVNDAYIWGVSDAFDEIRSFDIARGRYFSPNELAGGYRVAVIGKVTAETIFEDTDPIGKDIIISGYKTRVIGVFKKEGQGGISDSGMDEMTVIPVNYAKRVVNMRNPFINTNIMIKAREGIAVQELSDEATMILRASRRIKPDEINNFSVNRASLLTQGFEAFFSGINVGGWIIGGFSILVGGFGIANIMFVSVRERTHIIGIQMAVGAKRAFILWQFLYESILLSVTGGILGLIFIFIGTGVVNYIWEMNMHLTAGNIFLGVMISAVIGMIAGYAPAYSASRMNPVDAIGFSF